MNNLDIKEIRKKWNITQAEFAKMLGVDTRTVQNWESGGKIPASKYEIIRKIEANGNPMGQVFYGGDQINDKGNNIQGNNVKVTSPGDFDRFIDALKEQQALTAKALAQNERLITLLERTIPTTPQQ